MLAAFCVFAVSLAFIRGSVLKELILSPHSDLFSGTENHTGKYGLNSESLLNKWYEHVICFFVEIETGGLETYQKIGSSYLKLWFGTFPTQSVVHSETAVVDTHHSLSQTF